MHVSHIWIICITITFLFISPTKNWKKINVFKDVFNHYLHFYSHFYASLDYHIVTILL